MWSHEGNLGIAVYSFLTVIIHIFTSKNCKINIIYCKITWNVWLDILTVFSLYIVWEQPINSFIQ